MSEDKMKFRTIRMEEGKKLEIISKPGTLLTYPNGRSNELVLAVDGRKTITVGRGGRDSENVKAPLWVSHNKGYSDTRGEFTIHHRSTLNRSHPGRKYSFRGMTKTVYDWAMEADL